MNIQEDYVSFEIAKLLKEKGFDERTCGFYYDNSAEAFLISTPSYHNKSINVIAAPTHQMAMKWLREVHKLYINVCPSVEGYYWTEKWHSYVYDLNKRYPFGRFISTLNSPEEACEAAIKYCLENLLTPPVNK